TQAVWGSNSATYVLNALGQRVVKTPNVGAATVFHYDAGGTLVAESNTAGAVGKEYIYLNGTPVALVNATAPTVLYYVHPDHLDTARVITNNANAIVWRWDGADPFGSALANENSSGLGTFIFNPRFPGQYFDKETRLHYNYFRDYDPGTGRYVESDPVGLDGGLNAYAYVGGNPLRWSDRFGLQVVVPANPAAGAAGGGTWWGSRQKRRDPSGFEDQLFPDASKKPGIKWPDWLRPWINSESMDEEESTSETPPERGLPPPGIKPPTPDADKCTVGPASRPSERNKGGKSTWDPYGGEWRYFPEDIWHNPHWDYNPHDRPSSPWQNIPIGGLPPRKS
ncbi:MAG: RHS repeat-associated core domain-containing protein, partial [Betaproteobacteria bacterium]